MGNKTMPRLKGFDYKRPYFYMVTLKALPGVAAFSQIVSAAEPPRDEKGRPKFLELTALTLPFAKIIRGFHQRFRGLAPIETFIIMPDHLHILFKIEDSGDQFALGKYVYQLEKALAIEYWRILADGTATDTTLTFPRGEDSMEEGVARGQSSVGSALSDPVSANPAPIFAPDWHDWIVKKKGQLAAFTRYIRENPRRAWLRRRNRQYFASVSKVDFLGREWFAYGNTALLALPALLAVKGHRATKPNSPEWDALVERCSRLGEGCAGVSTFMSPLEKACSDAIVAVGGSRIVLFPEGFRDRWHPGREYEAHCAEGRVLFLSLYDALDHIPTRSELYHRCHEMGDLVAQGLS